MDYKAISKAITDPENQPHQWGDYELAQFLVSAADEIERLREENEKLLRNAKQDAEMMMAYNRICQKHGFAPSSSDLIAALQQKESK